MLPSTEKFETATKTFSFHLALPQTAVVVIDCQIKLSRSTFRIIRADNKGFCPSPPPTLTFSSAWNRTRRIIRIKAIINQKSHISWHFCSIKLLPWKRKLVWDTRRLCECQLSCIYGVKIGNFINVKSHFRSYAECGRVLPESRDETRDLCTNVDRCERGGRVKRVREGDILTRFFSSVQRWNCICGRGIGHRQMRRWWIMKKWKTCICTGMYRPLQEKLVCNYRYVCFV